MGVLSLAIWVPIVVGAALLAFGRDEQTNGVRWAALAGSVVSLVATLPLYLGFQNGTAAMQFVEKHDWIARFNIHYHVGLDGISLWLVLLTAFITVVVVISAWQVITERVNQYMGAFLILSGTDDRNLQRARRSSVLRLLRSHTDPDVSHHRHMGRAQQDLRGVQVLSLHTARLAFDAGRVDLSVQQVGRELRHPDMACAATGCAYADFPVFRFLRSIRRQGADVAGTHLVAGRARRSAHRRLGGAGRHHAEAGRLWLSALFDADRA